MASQAELSKFEEPIAALSSGSGPGAIAIIRISGKSCHQLFSGAVEPIHGRIMAPGKIHRCRIIDPQTRQTLDEAMAVFFFAPKSYTGQDSIEIFCHGGPFIVKSILDLSFRLGARMADPGEFTRRAFLNGKMDLTSAEGIQELVTAQSHQQWMAARYLAEGKLGGRIHALRKQLIDALAYLEALIDFPEEEDVQHLHRKNVRMKVLDVRGSINDLIANYRSARVATQGLQVAIMGEPNVGKSTLLNELLGHERAIVTNIAGTTRDYIEETCIIDGRLLRLVDTAGWRSTQEPVEKIGIENSLQIAREADLVLILLEAQEAIEEQQKRLAKHIAGVKCCLFLLTKTDLCPHVVVPPGWLGISVSSGEGLVALRKQLACKVDDHIAPLKEAAFVTNVRHLRALHEAGDGIDRYCKADDEGAFEECLCFELQAATRSLASIVGEVAVDDLLDKIFSQFCIGK